MDFELKLLTPDGAPGKLILQVPQGGCWTISIIERHRSAAVTFDKGELKRLIAAMTESL